MPPAGTLCLRPLKSDSVIVVGDAHDVPLVGRRVGVGVLSDLCDDSPRVESDQAMALAHVEVQHVVRGIAAHPRLIVTGTSADPDRPLDDSPYLAALQVVLPREASTGSDEQ
jgi:hypothetical protein